MQLTFLGTGGWYPLPRHTTCCLLETSKANFILDLGTGSVKLQQHLNINKPTFVLLSHYHLDHLIGLFWLAAVFKGTKLTICGQKGVEKVLNGLIRKPYNPWSLKDTCKFKLEYKEFDEGEYSIGDSKISTAFLTHSDPTLGYRIETDGKALAYITDTAPCRKALTLAKNCDILIHEASWAERADSKPGTHTTAKEAAEIAKLSNAKKLFMYHIMPEEKPAELEKAAKKVFKQAFAAKDDLTIKL